MNSIEQKPVNDSEILVITKLFYLTKPSLISTRKLIKYANAIRLKACQTEGRTAYGDHNLKKSALFTHLLQVLLQFLSAIFYFKDAEIWWEVWSQELFENSSSDRNHRILWPVQASFYFWLHPSHQMPGLLKFQNGRQSEGTNASRKLSFTRPLILSEKPCVLTKISMLLRFLVAKKTNYNLHNFQKAL